MDVESAIEVLSRQQAARLDRLEWTIAQNNRGRVATQLVLTRRAGRGTRIRFGMLLIAKLLEEPAHYNGLCQATMELKVCTKTFSSGERTQTLKRLAARGLTRERARLGWKFKRNRTQTRNGQIREAMYLESDARMTIKTKPIKAIRAPQAVGNPSRINGADSAAHHVHGDW